MMPNIEKWLHLGRAGRRLLCQGHGLWVHHVQRRCDHKPGPASGSGAVVCQLDGRGTGQEQSAPAAAGQLEVTGANSLSANQKQFVEDAEAQELDVDFGYSGRGMYGKTCPAVRVNSTSEFVTAATYKTDQMGKGLVMYAER